MIGLDTNVLARYYIQDESDLEATRQHEVARRLIESGKPLMVSKTVLLELEWVMRGYYVFAPAEIAGTLRHLLSLSHMVVEDRGEVERALANADAGLEFADALHLASYLTCDGVASFDDRKFARRARRKGLMPRIFVPD